MNKDWIWLLKQLEFHLENCIFRVFDNLAFANWDKYRIVFDPFKTIRFQLMFRFSVANFYSTRHFSSNGTFCIEWDKADFKWVLNGSRTNEKIEQVSWMEIRARKKCENACDDDNKAKVIRWKRQKGGKRTM